MKETFFRIFGWHLEGKLLYKAFLQDLNTQRTVLLLVGAQVVCHVPLVTLKTITLNDGHNSQ